LAWIYITLGIVAMLLELIVPGGIVMCLGLSSIVIGILVYNGFIQSASMSFMWCAILSVILVFPIQWILKRFSPDPETSVGNIDEDAECFGQWVTITKDVKQNDDSGRIRFQGTEWPASIRMGTLAIGNRAKIIGRDNLVWIVEAEEENATSSEG
jgi:inner membrane protein